MRIKLEELTLHEPMQIAIQGDEAWLANIYKYFPTPAGHAQKLAGNFELLRIEGDFVQVKGELNYQPLVLCSRCSQPMAWPVDERVEVYIQPAPPAPLAGERELVAAELDEYFLVDGAVDLEGLVNDAVQLAIPTRTAAACPVCADTDASDDCVYATRQEGEEEEAPASNPFAVLKRLKLDD